MKSGGLLPSCIHRESLRSELAVNSQMSQGDPKGSLTVALTTHRDIGNRGRMNLCAIESNKPSIEGAIKDKPQIGPG
jgi:hypothetical protein